MYLFIVNVYALHEYLHLSHTVELSAGLYLIIFQKNPPGVFASWKAGTG